MATRRVGIDWDQRKAYKKAWYQANKEVIAIRIKAHTARQNDTFTEDRRAYMKVWYENNKEQCQIKGRDYRQTSHYKTHHKLYQRDWRANTRDLQSGYRKKYYQANREKSKAYSVKWMRENRQRNHVAALKCRMRARIYAALRAHLDGSTRKAIGAVALIGCTMQELAAHLEAQFLPGMTWQNRRQWHVDHIRPCCTFDLSDPTEQRKCFHFTNLQPLWAADNRRKSSWWEGKHHSHRATATPNLATDRRTQTMTDWQERAEKAEARVIELETLTQQYEEKLKLARLITWRDGDEGISPLASPVPSDKPPLTSHEGFPASASAASVLDKYDWNLFFGHFPNFEDGQVYRIYKSHTSTQNELIGYGKTPTEAIEAALRATATPNPLPTGEPKL
jgi:hypothetical protein